MPYVIHVYIHNSFKGEIEEHMEVLAFDTRGRHINFTGANEGCKCCDGMLSDLVSRAVYSSTKLGMVGLLVSIDQGVPSRT